MIQSVLQELLHLIPEIMWEVGIAFLPIIAMFIIYQFTLLKLPKSRILSMSAGIIYAYVGLVLFFLGLEIGFSSTGTFLGNAIGAMPSNWILIPIGLVIGFAVILAEPAVASLVRQVDALTGGTIHKSAIYLSLCISVALAVALAMARAIWGISLLYFIIPGYAIALILAKISPPIFTAIAFDSGGVASGPMTTTFILSFTLGVTSVVNPSAGISESFGVIAMVAMTPLITLQILGLIFVKKSREAEQALQMVDSEEVLANEFEEEDDYEITEDMPNAQDDLFDDFANELLENQVDTLKAAHTDNTDTNTTVNNNDKEQGGTDKEEGTIDG